MDKQKFFLIFIVAGAFIIFLQQGSLLNPSHNINKSSLNPARQSNNQEQDDNKIVQYLEKPHDWGYNKFIFELSKSMSIYNKSHSKEKLKSLMNKFNPLNRFTVYDGVNQSRVLILAYFRSGSSFLGDLMQQNWKTFYTFEPLHYMTRQIRIDSTNLTEAINLISDIYNCNFKRNGFYIQWIRKNQFLLKWNKFLWNVCKFRSPSCFDEEYLHQVCQRSKYNVMKVVRLQMKHLETLWGKIEPLNVKVVYLVRDPRGIYNSRKSMEWCNKEEICANISNICSKMRQDLIDYDRLKPLMGNNLVLVRYEDITSDPIGKTKQLFSDIQLKYSTSVSRFLRTHTHSHSVNEQNENPYSTYRANSTSTAYQWIKELNSTEIELAQNSCGDILKRLNYKIL